MDKFREPTGDECGANAKVFEDDLRVGHAIWYPQMGGYVGKAFIMNSGNGFAWATCRNFCLTLIGC